MNSKSNLLYKDDGYSFYLSETERAGCLLLEVFDSFGKCIFSHMFLAKFGNNPTQKVFKGHSGTYTYFKFTAKCDNIVQELILLKLGGSVLRPIYLDKTYADSNTTRLVVSTTKGGLKVVRKLK